MVSPPPIFVSETQPPYQHLPKICCLVHLSVMAIEHVEISALDKQIIVLDV